MKQFELTCGAIVLLDDEDYEKIPKSGWYIASRDTGRNSRATYVEHKELGKLHRYILGLTKDDNIIVDHIDRNGLNNQKSNLRLVSCSTNKRNQDTVKTNKFHFNGISFERQQKRSPRFRVRWSTNEPDTRYGDKRFKQKTKSFTVSKYESIEDCLKDAILFRISKMIEYNYVVDERSTTIEREILSNPNCNIWELLGISPIE